MSMRYLGGVISSTPPSINPNGASGVWTLEQQFQAQGDAVWPPLGDPNFENVTLLLHGDGTNGGQNNTFIDGSTNNFAITRNGNTTQGSFGPYGDLWSNYFDGTGDYLSVPDNAAFEIGAGNFTVESWVYLTGYSANYSGNYVAMVVGKDSTTSRGFHFAISGTASSWTRVYALLFSNNTTFTETSVNYTFSLNTWYHVAFVRNGTSLRIYVNGVDVGGGTNSINVQDSTPVVSVGSITYTSFEYYFPGYLSNVRFVKATALYTTNFTPSTTPLTAITNTSLLTCQSNRFIDNSSNNFAITRNGDVSVQRFSPFAPSAAYSTATIGGSGYFDGNGDYLRTEDSTAYDLPGDFTVEGWLYPIATVSNNYLSIALGSENSAQNGFNIFANTTNMGLYANAANVISVANKVRLGEWNHFAVSRSGTTLRFFLNGVQEGSATNSTSFTGVTGNGFGVGAAYTTSYIARANGYYSDVRLVKGTALYTSNFTPPTAPLTAIANTSLLLNFTNASIFDNAAMANLETVGNAQINTSYKKFGTGSLAFDGNGDYLTTPASPQLNLTSGNFTIEMWVYWSGANASGNIVSKDGVGGTSYNQYVVQLGGANKITCSVGSGNGVSSIQTITSSTNLPTNTWTHLAFVKNGTNLSLYQDGVSVASATQTATMIEGNKPLFIGWQSNQGADNYWSGYIDDLRITKGVARYTASFTPPEAPFPNY